MKENNFTQTPMQDYAPCAQVIHLQFLSFVMSKFPPAPCAGTGGSNMPKGVSAGRLFRVAGVAPWNWTSLP